MTDCIYIVDDNAAVRASLHGLLSLRPNGVIRSFCNGDEFLEVAAMLDPGVVLLDLHMPGSSGLDVLNAIHDLDLKKFATVIVTGEGNVERAIEAMKAGAFNVIEKPYDAETLFRTIDGAFSCLAHDSAVVAHAEQARAKIDGLSPREREVLLGLIEGRANKVIGLALQISTRMVQIYRANLMTKLDVRNLPEALRIAFAAGLIPAA